MIFLQVILALDHSRAAVVLEQRHKRLSFVQHAICTYVYEVAVHTARGAHSTASDGFELHALVSHSCKPFRRIKIIRLKITFPSASKRVFLIANFLYFLVSDWMYTYSFISIARKIS